MYDREALKNPDEAESEVRQALAAPSRNRLTFISKPRIFSGTMNKPAEYQPRSRRGGRGEPQRSAPRLLPRRRGVLSNTNLPDAEQNLKSYLASTPDRSDWPSHAAAREWLGRLYEAQGKRAEAAEQYRAALQLEPKNKEAKAAGETRESPSRSAARLPCWESEFSHGPQREHASSNIGRLLGRDVVARHASVARQ